MEPVVSLLILKLIKWGFVDFIVFLIVMALLYALFKRSKLLGNSPILNGIVSFGIAFMVLVFPVLTGIGIVVPLSKFFTQAVVFILIFFFSFLIASLFYPNLIDWLPKVFTTRNTLWSMIGLGITLFITSGLVSIIYQSAASTQTTTSSGISPVSSETQATAAGSDIYIIIAGLIIFIVILLISSSVGKSK